MSEGKFLFSFQPLQLNPIFHSEIMNYNRWLGTNQKQMVTESRFHDTVSEMTDFEGEMIDDLPNISFKEDR